MIDKNSNFLFMICEKKLFYNFQKKQILNERPLDQRGHYAAPTVTSQLKIIEPRPLSAESRSATPKRASRSK